MAPSAAAVLTCSVSVAWVPVSRVVSRRVRAVRGRIPSINYRLVLADERGRDPVQSQHYIGKLLKYLGPDNIVWGTDALVAGEPQGQIDIFRNFQITDEYVHNALRADGARVLDRLIDLARGRA